MVIQASLHDYLIPLRCNSWYQVGIMAFATGLLLLFVTLLQMHWEFMYWALPLKFFGFVIVLGTMFGKETTRAYYRTRRHIQNFGMFDHRTQLLLAKQRYCVRVGAKLAARELGVHDLVPALTAKWRIF